MRANVARVLRGMAVTGCRASPAPTVIPFNLELASLSEASVLTA